MSIGVRRWKPAGARQEPVQGDLGFRKLDADLYLAHQLFRAGCSSQVTAGVTTFAERRERIRAEIVRRGFEDRQLIDGHSKTIEESFSQAFERLYGEAFQPQRNGETA